MKTDPITLEILGNKFAATVEEMAITLLRTGRTLYVKETADFATALAGLDGKFVAYPNGLGVSCYIDLDCRGTIEAVGELQPGDIIITNHPYDSEGMVSHIPDLSLIKPYFHDDRIIGYGFAFVHLTDMGGKVPSSISPSNTEIFQEGLLVPPMHLMRAGDFVPEVVAFLKANVRTPEENYGDLKAMIAALAVGERRVAEMVERYGIDDFLQAQEDIIDYSKRKARAVLRRIPDGTYEFWDYMDDDASTGIPIRLRVAMTVEDGRVELDFSGTDPQLSAPYNIPASGRRHPWLSLRLAAFIFSHDPTIPLNAGMFNDIHIRARPETIVSPEFPAPVGIRHATAQRLYETVNGALAQAVPDMVTACSGGVLIPTVFAESKDSDNGRNVIVVEPMVGGMGARLGRDGVDGRDSSLANLANNPIESVETSVDIRIHAYGLRPDSGGPGEWRGGVGCRLTFEVLRDGGLVLGRGMDRFRFAPWGLAGGQSSLHARTILNYGQPNEQELGKVDAVRVDAGDTLTILTPGGGGYGDPFNRKPESVLRDVRLGFVTADGAEQDYGVAIVDGAIDFAETERLRRTERRKPANGHGLFCFGREREAWEQVFDDHTMGVLNNHLFSMPIALRQDERFRLFRLALPDLLQGAKISGLVNHPVVARERLRPAITNIAAE